MGYVCVCVEHSQNLLLRAEQITLQSHELLLRLTCTNFKEVLLKQRLKMLNPLSEAIENLGCLVIYMEKHF